jgi:hypothetical protein
MGRLLAETAVLICAMCARDFIVSVELNASDRDDGGLRKLEITEGAVKWRRRISEVADNSDGIRTDYRDKGIHCSYW